MSRLIDLTGKRFGDHVAVAEVGRDKHGQAVWRCDCGREHDVPGGRLRRGESRSCGCTKGARCGGAR
jgi:hypothetical protein